MLPDETDAVMTLSAATALYGSPRVFPRPPDRYRIDASLRSVIASGQPLMPVRSGLDRKRHATRAPRPQTPPRRRQQDSPDPPATRPAPAPSPARLRGPPMGGCSGVPAAGRLAKAATAGSGTRPAAPQPCRAPRARRPYDLRHAALSLWLASGAPPAEVAARAGHSVRVLLTIYAHCIPGCGQIASQQIERALRPRQWPPAGPQEPARTPGFPSVMRPCHSWTQWDSAGPDTSAQIRLRRP